MSEHADGDNLSSQPDVAPRCSALPMVAVTVR